MNFIKDKNNNSMTEEERQKLEEVSSQMVEKVNKEKLIVKYKFDEQKEIYPISLDSTGVFTTAEPHGLTVNKILFVAINENKNMIINNIPNQIFTNNWEGWTSYQVAEILSETEFKLNRTFTVTSTTDISLIKFYVDTIGVIELNNLPISNLKKIKLKIEGNCKGSFNEGFRIDNVFNNFNLLNYPAIPPNLMPRAISISDSLAIPDGQNALPRYFKSVNILEITENEVKHYRNNVKGAYVGYTQFKEYQEDSCYKMPHNGASFNTNWKIQIPPQIGLHNGTTIEIYEMGE